MAARRESQKLSDKGTPIYFKSALSFSFLYDHHLDTLARIQSQIGAMGSPRLHSIHDLHVGRLVLAPLEDGRGFRRAQVYNINIATDKDGDQSKILVHLLDFGIDIVCKEVYVLPEPLQVDPPLAILCRIGSLPQSALPLNIKDDGPVSSQELLKGKEVFLKIEDRIGPEVDLLVRSSENCPCWSYRSYLLHKNRTIP